MSIEIIRGENQTPIEPLANRIVAVVGYGNQGVAHALNLRESGVQVLVGQRPGSAGWDHALQDGFDPRPIADGVADADLVVIALPDEVHGEVYEASIAPALREGATVGFLHGFSIRFGLVTPRANVGVIMVAPKGPGTTLRQRFVDGLGLPCLFAMHQDSEGGDAEAIGLAWARGIGAARAGIIRTTFAAEAETDLFGEQAVLCGGMTGLILAAFETMVEAGYPPELAYVECCHEAKQVADLVYERGLAGMTGAISNTAEFGTYSAGPRLVDDAMRERMRGLLAEVRDGTFARAVIDDHRAGGPWMGAQRQALARHPIEPAGEVIRDLMIPPRPVSANAQSGGSA
jgi:ketol-acid reductoisomerase